MELPKTTNDITAEWLNVVLHDNGFLGSNNILSLNHEPIGIDKGFQSDMVKLSVNYQHDAPQLPSTMIAKLPPSLRPPGSDMMINSFFERETRFYMHIADKSPIRTPGLIYGVIDSGKQRYVLILEDCSRYSELDTQQQGLSYDKAEMIVLKIADFHSTWWEHKDLSSFTWLPLFSDPALNSIYVNIFRDSWEHNIKTEDFRESLPPGGWEAGLKIYENRPLLHERAPTDKLTISHGDFRSNNIFFDSEDLKNPLIFFDWGIACIGRGTFDISYLLGFSLSTELRKRSEKDLLKLYFNRLLEGGVTDYTFSECYTDYLRGLLFYTITPINLFRAPNEEIKMFGKAGLERMFTAIVDNDATNILS